MSDERIFTALRNFITAKCYCGIFFSIKEVVALQVAVALFIPGINAVYHDLNIEAAFFQVFGVEVDFGAVIFELTGNRSKEVAHVK